MVVHVRVGLRRLSRFMLRLIYGAKESLRTARDIYNVVTYRGL